MNDSTADTASAAARFQVPKEVAGITAGRAIALGRTGHRIEVINPATEAVISHLREDNAEDVAAAVRAAREAFDSGPWPRLELSERRKILRQIRQVLQDHAEELAWLECVDTGVPLQDIRARKLPRMLDNFEFAGDLASMASGQTWQQNGRYLTYVTRDPVGVAAIIAPWNAPMTLASMQFAPCIALGNCCVIKPSEHAPLSLYRLVELLHEAGLPPGVVNLVNGRGSVTGDALVRHAGIDVVKFIGGTGTGKSIMAAAAMGLKEVGLELGGKSANIIFADADLDAALDGALLGIYSSNGQQCLAGSRILVQRPVLDAFIERFVARARQIRVGDPLDPATEMGPLAFKEHYERVLSYVDVARADGAKLLVGGSRPAGLKTGYYLAPTAVLAPGNDTRVCQEEIFGPFATFLAFDSRDEAIAIANQSRFGLVSYVWSSNLENVMVTSRELRAGTIWVNTPLVRELRAPFGGYKESGVGRDSAQATLDFYTESKTTTIPVGPLTLHKMGSGVP